MGGTLLTTLSMENLRPSTILSMDSSSSSSRDESERELHQPIILSSPPDINLPLIAERSPPPESWNIACDILDASLGPQMFVTDKIVNLPKVGRKSAKRLDSVWGAWFFFSFYFRPVLNRNSRCKVTTDNLGISGYDKSDLQLDVFLVQHDMENIYMWVFKEKPENALGKMQLRSFMNGHSRHGERQFPFSVDKGFVRSHKMQRKHYRGLSNPQCIHGVEVVCTPNLAYLDEQQQKKWAELTGRDFNFSIPLESSDFESWRNLPNGDFELYRPLLPPLKNNSSPCPTKLLNSAGLYLSNCVDSDGVELLPVSNKRKKGFPLHENDDNCSPNNLGFDRVLDMDVHLTEPHWLNEFTGVMRNGYRYGPVTAAKSIYEDEEGFLIIVTLPFVDLQKVKVTWRNALSHGIVKISCVSTACMPFVKRQDRTFKLTDSTPEHWPPGEFIREIPLATRIPEDAKLEAYCDETGTMLEIFVPKHCGGLEEHEVRVCLRPVPWIERVHV